MASARVILFLLILWLNLVLTFLKEAGLEILVSVKWSPQ